MKLPLEKIRTDGGTQMRAFTDESLVEDYREAMEEGAKFPPLDVFFDGTEYWLADGFHRIIAAVEAKKKAFEVKIHKGTLREAILWAAGANAHHGKQRTNADKRRCVEHIIRDKEWAERTDTWIAKSCRVSWRLVADMRRELKIDKGPNRLARNGRKIKTENISAAAKKRAADRAALRKTAAAPEPPNEPPPAAAAPAPELHSGDANAEAERERQNHHLRMAISHTRELHVDALLELRIVINQRVVALRGQDDAA